MKRWLIILLFFVDIFILYYTPFVSCLMKSKMFNINHFFAALSVMIGTECRDRSESPSI
jgi:hypothetical protein